MTTPRFIDSYNYQTKLFIPGSPWNIYGHPVNWNYYVKTPLAVASEAERSFDTGNKKAHTRRRYVNDPSPSNVDGHVFDYVTDPGRKVGSAVPGWSFVMDDGLERRQFTTTGDVKSLIQYLETDGVKQTVRVYTQGARYTIKFVADNP